MKASSAEHGDKIHDVIRRIVAAVPGCFLAVHQIQPEHRLREDLGLDSLAMVDLMVAVEDTLDVYFDPIQMDLDAAFETVASLADLVTQLTGG